MPAYTWIGGLVYLVGIVAYGWYSYRTHNRSLDWAITEGLLWPVMLSIKLMDRIKS